MVKGMNALVCYTGKASILLVTSSNFALLIIRKTALWITLQLQLHLRVKYYACIMHYVVTITKSNPMKQKKLIDYSMIAHLYNSFRNQATQIS